MQHHTAPFSYTMNSRPCALQRKTTENKPLLNASVEALDARGEEKLYVLQKSKLRWSKLNKAIAEKVSFGLRQWDIYGAQETKHAVLPLMSSHLFVCFFPPFFLCPFLFSQRVAWPCVHTASYGLGLETKPQNKLFLGVLMRLGAPATVCTWASCELQGNGLIRPSYSLAGGHVPCSA